MKTVCSQCDGKGRGPYATGEIVECFRCHGTGNLEVSVSTSNEKLAEWLLENRISSLGPQDGIKLCQIRDEIASVAKKLVDSGANLDLDPEVRAGIKQYLTSLINVIEVSVAHQGAVLSVFETLLKGGKL